MNLIGRKNKEMTTPETVMENKVMIIIVIILIIVTTSN